MLRLFRDVLKETRGATSAEYAVLAALIAGVIFGVVRLFGASVSGLFQTAVNAFSGAG
jgi:Flp pilus assembly pilin Flp